MVDLSRLPRSGKSDCSMRRLGRSETDSFAQIALIWRVQRSSLEFHLILTSIRTYDHVEPRVVVQRSEKRFSILEDAWDEEKENCKCA